jgi:L-iditol 2-dehydrogenase
MHAMLAKTNQAKTIFCLDVHEFRLEFAEKFGITSAIKSNNSDRKQIILGKTDGRGVDVSIVATSSLEAFVDAIDVTRKGGTVVMFGVPSKGAKIDLDMSIVYSKEITLITSYAASDIDTNSALQLIESSQIDVKKLITHRYALQDSQKAFEHAQKGSDSMKIIITN